MIPAEDILVLSDLHLAPERGSGLFQEDETLAGFLNWVMEQDSRLTYVVIAGDLLDFLVPQEKGEKLKTFDPQNAPQRTRSILDWHPEVFDALARIAGSPRHRLMILNGNHDPELILPAVQQVIESRLATGGASSVLRWLVHGEAARFQVGTAAVSIEHGDLFDDWNRVDRDGLRRALSRISRGFIEEHGFHAPPGSQLVLDFLTELRNQFPWVDYLKPEREAVIPILNHFLPVQRRADLRRVLQPWLRYQGNALETLGLKLLPPVALIRGPEDRKTKRKKLADWLREQKEQVLERFQEVRREKLLERLRAASAEDGYFDIERPDDAAGEIAQILDRGTDLVVQGHTHAAKAYPLGTRGLYFNTGTWGQLLALPGSEDDGEEWNAFLDSLENCRQRDFVRPTFARIRRDSAEGTTFATLHQWETSQLVSLARFRFNDDQRTWTNEV
jgi:UDP-2,3-diacylglucosamine pyrophosphatase LpxH